MQALASFSVDAVPKTRDAVSKDKDKRQSNSQMSQAGQTNQFRLKIISGSTVQYKVFRVEIESKKTEAILKIPLAASLPD
jgi:hypothetical protein